MKAAVYFVPRRYNSRSVAIRAWKSRQKGYKAGEFGRRLVDADRGRAREDGEHETIGLLVSGESRDLDDEEDPAEAEYDAQCRAVHEPEREPDLSELTVGKGARGRRAHDPDDAESGEEDRGALVRVDHGGGDADVADDDPDADLGGEIVALQPRQQRGADAQRPCEERDKGGDGEQQLHERCIHGAEVEYPDAVPAEQQERCGDHNADRGVVRDCVGDQAPQLVALTTSLVLRGVLGDRRTDAEVEQAQVHGHRTRDQEDAVVRQAEIADEQRHEQERGHQLKQRYRGIRKGVAGDDRLLADGSPPAFVRERVHLSRPRAEPRVSECPAAG
jgi:hypothetical protein